MTFQKEKRERRGQSLFKEIIGENIPNLRQTSKFTEPRDHFIISMLKDLLRHTL